MSDTLAEAAFREVFRREGYLATLAKVHPMAIVRVLADELAAQQAEIERMRDMERKAAIDSAMSADDCITWLYAEGYEEAGARLRGAILAAIDAAKAKK